MNYNEVLQVVIDYMEDRLTHELNIDDLASLIGFSSSHFQRLFYDCTKLTVGQYLNKRKLEHAVYEMSKGVKSVDVALNYGFKTYAGFYKAFKKEFGCSPRLYLQYVEVSAPQQVNLSEQSFKRFSYAELKQVLMHWELPKQIRISDIDGKRRDRWLVNERYVLKFLTQLNEVEKIISLSELLDGQDIVVPILVELSDGRKIIQKYGVYFYLESYIETLLPVKLHEISTYMGHQIGNRIGAIHEVFQTYPSKDSFQNVDFVAMVCEWAVPQVRNQLKTWNSNIPDDFLDDFICTVQAFEQTLPVQFIHRKLSVKNLLIKDNVVLGIRNMELSERNFRLFDLCYFGTSLLAEYGQDEGFKEQWLEVFNGVVAGYNEQVQLTQSEKESILSMLLAIQFIFIAYLKNQREELDLLVRNIEMVSFIYENRKQLSV